MASAGLGAWLVVSSSRARISLTTNELSEQGDLRRHNFATTEINQFFVDRTPHVVPWFSIWVRLSSGEVRALQQTRVLGRRRGPAFEELDRAAASMNQWLSEQQ